MLTDKERLLQRLEYHIKGLAYEWQEMGDIGFRAEKDLQGRLLGLLRGDSTLVYGFEHPLDYVRVPLVHLEVPTMSGGNYDLALFKPEVFKEALTNGFKDIFFDRLKVEDIRNMINVDRPLLAAIEIKNPFIYFYTDEVKENIKRLIANTAQVEYGYMLIFYCTRTKGFLRKYYPYNPAEIVKLKDWMNNEFGGEDAKVKIYCIPDHPSLPIELILWKGAHYQIEQLQDC